MSHAQFLPHSVDGCLAHLIEEFGEALAAAGKTARFGFHCVNPLLPVDQQERNVDWLRRELADARQAMDRLEAKMREAGL